jgi:hypothetical protein
LWIFTKREWFSLFLSTSLGVLSAESFNLAWRDHAFKASLVSHYKPWVSFDDGDYYVRYFAICFIATLLALGPLFSLNIWRGLKSWFDGVTSGLILLPFASAFSISILPVPTAPRRTRFVCGIQHEIR